LGDTEACVAAMEEFAMAKWVETADAVETFSEEAKTSMSEKATVDTGNLQNAIDTEVSSMGVMAMQVGTFINDDSNPINNISAAVYGYFQNYGFTNSRSKKFIPGVFFMEDGAEEAFAALMGILEGIW
jgi:hypothetical protein